MKEINFLFDITKYINSVLLNDLFSIKLANIFNKFFVVFHILASN